MDNSSGTIWSELPSAFYWAIAILIFLIFFSLLFRQSIIRLIERTKKVGKGGAKFAMSQSDPKQEISMDKKSNEKKETPLIQGLQLCDAETKQKFNDIVIRETDLSNQSTDEEKIDILVQYSTALSIFVQLERIYHIIYGSQIKLLQNLNYVGIRPKSDYSIYFADLVKNNPDWFKEVSFEQYLGYLIGNNLINEDKDGNISITVFGRDFLKYIVQYGLSDFKEL